MGTNGVVDMVRRVENEFGRLHLFLQEMEVDLPLNS